MPLIFHRKQRGKTGKKWTTKVGQRWITLDSLDAGEARAQALRLRAEQVADEVEAAAAAVNHQDEARPPAAPTPPPPSPPAAATSRPVLPLLEQLDAGDAGGKTNGAAAGGFLYGQWGTTGVVIFNAALLVIWLVAAAGMRVPATGGQRGV